MKSEVKTKFGIVDILVDGNYIRVSQRLPSYHSALQLKIVTTVMASRWRSYDIIL